MSHLKINLLINWIILKLQLYSLWYTWHKWGVSYDVRWKPHVLSQVGLSQTSVLAQHFVVNHADFSTVQYGGGRSTTKFVYAICYMYIDMYMYWYRSSWSSIYLMISQKVKRSDTIVHRLDIKANACIHSSSLYVPEVVTCDPDDTILNAINRDVNYTISMAQKLFLKPKRI